MSNDDLQEAERIVTETERHVTKLAVIIACLERGGLDELIPDARALLASFERSLALAHCNLNIVRAEKLGLPPIYWPDLRRGG